MWLISLKLPVRYSELHMPVKPYYIQDETVWLTQKLMAELFQTTSQNITIHLTDIIEEGELAEEVTCKDFLQVQKEGSI